MKTCPVCALELEDSYSFCPEDGSSLGPRVRERSIGVLTMRASAASRESDDEPAQAVVLYCPTCAAEYPLTFSECPVHGVTLAKHTLPSHRNQLANVPGVSGNSFYATDSVSQRQQEGESTSTALAPPQAENSRDDTTQAGGDIDPEIASPQTLTDGTVVTEASPEELTVVEDVTSEPPGFRIAAVATGVALVLFAIVSLYGLVTYLTRRPATNVARIASSTDVNAQPLPFVATPREAQDYKDEQPASESSARSEPQTESGGERRQTNSPLSIEQNVRKTTIVQASPKPPIVTARPQPERLTVSTPPASALPRGNSGGFDSRLVRARGTRTSSGYRYDLTFNMLEQAGRSAQWQRVLISARSASGTTHTAAIPFVHRLGAAGALTFTISVELTGRSQSDWQGHVTFTTLGWDNSGAPLQASFAANVTP